MEPVIVMKKKHILTPFLLVAVSTATYATNGINLIGIGPVQQGTAGAGVASAKDSTWLILNPAGLTHVGRSLDASVQYFSPSRESYSSANPGAGTQRDRSGFFIPELSASFGCCSRDSGYIGIGVYGTSGMGVDYENPRVPFSRGDTYTELSVSKLTLTYAEAFENGLSIGGGPILVLSRLRTDMETRRMPPSVPADGGWDTAFGVGFIVGATYRLTEKLSIGASYMTEQFMTEFDDYDNLLSDSLNLPQEFTIGLAYDVLDTVEVAVDYQWIGWGQLDTLGDQFGWEDQHVVKAGVTWDINDRFTWRAGISHGNSPIGEEDVFANALFPAIMETHLTTGFSYNLDTFSLHVAYIHALENELTDSNSPLAGGGTTISMYQNSLTVGVSWRF